MVESNQQASASEFRIKVPSKNAGNFTNIDEITHEFTDKGEPTSDVLCVKFDETDKYIGASYSNGVIKIFNSFTGKVASTIVNTFSALEETRVPISMFRFKPHG